MKKGTTTQEIPFSTRPKVRKKHVPIPPSEMVFFSIDLDTGYLTIEKSPADRKTEINPVGHYVGFSLTPQQFEKLETRLKRRPYLVEKYIKTL